MEGLELYGVVIISLIMGIVQLAKNAGLQSKFGGILALVIGLLIGLAYGLTEAGWSIFQSIIIGAMLGLSASGMYSTQKNAREQ